VNLQSPKFDVIKRPVALIAVASVLVLALLWWFLWMSPQGAKLSKTNAEIATLNTQYGTLQATLKVDEQQSAKVNLYAGYLNMFATAVPEVPDAGALTSEIASLADSISPNLTIVSITDDTTIPGTPLGMVPISVQLLGPRQNCFKFLSDLYNNQKMPRLITISSFAPTPVTPKQGGENVLVNNAQMYNVTIAGDAYYDGDIDPGAAGSVPTTTLAAG